MSAVLFDIDGTLVDSVDLHARAWVEAFAHFGVQTRFDDVRSQIGKGGDQLVPVFVDAQQQRRFGEALLEYRAEHFRKHYLSQVRAFPCVRALFERVRAHGRQIALASSARTSELETYIRVADVGDLLEASTSADDENVAQSKPEPDVFLAALAKLERVDPRTVLVVGDSPYDAIAAKRAGLRTVGVLSGGFAERALVRAGCIAVYRDACDLLAHFDQSPLGR